MGDTFTYVTPLKRAVPTGASHLPTFTFTVLTVYLYSAIGAPSYQEHISPYSHQRGIS